MKPIAERSDFAIVEGLPRLSQFRSLSQSDRKRSVFRSCAQAFFVSSSMDQRLQLDPSTDV
jgi:hypothetical protein